MRGPLIVVVLLTKASLVAAAPPAISWRQLQPGLAYAVLPVTSPAGIKIADRNLHLVRLEAGAAALLRVGLAASRDSRPRTAADWSRELRLAVVINLGMYYEDHLTHVGYLRSGRLLHSKRWLPRYDSLLVIGARRASLLDRPVPEPELFRHDVVVQNLRLIRSPDGRRGEGVWSAQPKRWSEAALAMDARGNLLFIFTRVPFSMRELTGLLLSLPLGVVRAMHLEGGPEASLSIHAGGVDLDLCGSFESGFFGSDLNASQWSIPNVLGVARR